MMLPATEPVRLHRSITPSIRVECVDDMWGFTALRPEWNDLLRSSAADCPFLTWEWLHTWWKHLGSASSLRLIAVRSILLSVRVNGELRRGHFYPPLKGTLSSAVNIWRGRFESTPRLGEAYRSRTGDSTPSAQGVALGDVVAGGSGEEAELVLLASPACSELAALLPEIDEYFPYEAPWMKASPRPPDHSYIAVFSPLSGRSATPSLILTGSP